VTPPAPRVPGPWASRDPGVYSRPGAASVRPAALWDAIYELALGGGGGGLSQEEVQALIDASLVDYQALAEEGQPSGYAPLDAGGKVPTAHLPPLAITETFTVASEAAMLALPAQMGDVAIRTDTGRTYILAAEPATALANWQELAAAGQVTSVNGQTGAVLLDAADVGALDQATADGLYVNVSGDTMSGALTLQTPTTGIAYQSRTVSDTQPRFNIRTNGSMWWGPGGATAPDTNLFRNATGDLWGSFSLSPDATNTFDLGKSGLRYRKLWGVDADLSGGLTVATKAVAASPDAGNALVWNANGFYAPQPAPVDVTITGGGGISSTESPSNTFALALVASPDANNTVEVRANGLYAAAGAIPPEYVTDAELSTALAPYATDADLAAHAAAADPHSVYLTQGEADAAYQPAGSYAPTSHNHDAAYLNTSGGDTMTGPLTVSSGGVAVTGASTFSVAPTVGGSPLLTQTAGDARYLQPATAASTYVDAAGDTMTGDLVISEATPTLGLKQAADTQQRVTLSQTGLSVGPGGSTAPDTLLVRSAAATWRVTGHVVPATTNAYDLGASATRMRKLWGVDTDLSGALNVAGATTFTAAPTVGGSALLTQTAGDARYLQPATAASTYVPLAGGSVMTGPLGPTTTTTHDLGTSALRWRKTWGVDADLSGSLVVAVALTVATKAVALSATAGNTLAWNADGFWSDAPTKAQYDALVARVAALEGQMGAGANGHYHLMGTWRQTLKATLPATTLEEVPAA
jgi:hypothetical protein